MAWVRGIREVTHVVVAGNGVQNGHRSGPHMLKRRVVVDLPASTIQRTIERSAPVFLPCAAGAGPCGTLARSACVRGTLEWAVTYLAGPLRFYYAVYTPPMRFGAKPGPRGRRAA